VYVCLYRAVRSCECSDNEEAVGLERREDTEGENFLLLPVPHVPDDHLQPRQGEHQSESLLGPRCSLWSMVMYNTLVDNIH